MAEVVSSWQQSSFTTPVAGGALSASVVLGNDNTLRSKFNSHDADSGVHFQSSTVGARPSAGTAGRKWYTTDTKRVYYDNGVSWDEIAYLLTTGGTLTGALTVSSGGIAVTGNSTITGTLGGLTGLTVASGGAAVTGDSAIVGALAVTTAKTTLAAAAAGFASLNLPHATAPSSPANGDVWTTTTGLFVRLNGTTRTMATTSDLASFVTGSGTSGKLTKFTGTAAVGNSIITETGSALSVAGSLTTTDSLVTPAATSSIVSLYVPHGSTPSAPSDGAIWTTTAGLFVRVNGSTVGPIGAPGGGGTTGSGTSGTLTKWTGTTSLGDSIVTESGAALSVAGTLTTTGAVITPASASGSAGLRLPHGSAPSSPTNGDVWTTTAGTFVRINGATVTLGTGTVSGTTGKVPKFTGSTAIGDSLLEDDGTNPKFSATLLPTANATLDVGSTSAEVRRIHLDGGSGNGVVIDGNRIVGPRVAGFGSYTGTENSDPWSSAADLATLTTKVGAIWSALKTHGLI